MPLSPTLMAGANNIEYTTSNIPAFLNKLWTLVEDSKYDELIAWDPSGFSFHVFDQSRFSREILPRFFKHNNMASFIRQLNMYGFRKVNSIDHGSLKIEKEDMEFHHPYFIRGKEQFLEFIKRKVTDLKPSLNQSGSNNAINNNSIIQTAAVAANNANQLQQQQKQLQLQHQQILSLQYPQVKSDELNKALDDVNVIKSKQKIVDESLFNVKKENEALWKEIATLRQKHHQQQQIVNKLIHFLVHLVNPTTLGIKRTRPLMIDSHSTASLINGDEDDQINEIADNEEDEDYIITSVDSTNAKNYRNIIMNENFNGNKPKQKQKQQLVELEDDSEYREMDEATDADTNEKYNKNYITEIETINLNKTNGETSNRVNLNDSNDTEKSTNTNKKKISNTDIESTNLRTINANGVKKLKKNLDDNSITSRNNNQMTNTKTTDLKQSSVLNTPNNPEFLDANLFLNTDSPQNAVESNIQSPPSLPINSQMPIVTQPDSPLVNANIQSSNSGNQSASLTNPSQQLTPINSSLIDQQQNNNFRRTISSLKNSSNNQMNEHIESLQIDLNSIKEYLSSNSFTQIDPYTINNLFSPIVLDQFDQSEFYLEQPLNSSAALLNQENTNNAINYYSNNNNNNDNDNSTSNASNVNNGKIIGNEIIQYDSFHSSDIFDELFNTNETKTSIVPKLAPSSLTTVTLSKESDSSLGISNEQPNLVELADSFNSTNNSNLINNNTYIQQTNANFDDQKSK